MEGLQKENNNYSPSPKLDDLPQEVDANGNPYVPPENLENNEAKVNETTKVNQNAAVLDENALNHVNNPNEEDEYKKKPETKVNDQKTITVEPKNDFDIRNDKIETLKKARSDILRNLNIKNNIPQRTTDNDEGILKEREQKVAEINNEISGIDSTLDVTQQDIKRYMEIREADLKQETQRHNDTNEQVAKELDHKEQNSIKQRLQNQQQAEHDAEKFAPQSWDSNKKYENILKKTSQDYDRLAKEINMERSKNPTHKVGDAEAGTLNSNNEDIAENDAKSKKEILNKEKQWLESEIEKGKSVAKDDISKKTTPEEYLAYKQNQAKLIRGAKAYNDILKNCKDDEKQTAEEKADAKYIEMQNSKWNKIKPWGADGGNTANLYDAKEYLKIQKEILDNKNKNLEDARELPENKDNEDIQKGKIHTIDEILDKKLKNTNNKIEDIKKDISNIGSDVNHITNAQFFACHNDKKFQNYIESSGDTKEYVKNSDTKVFTVEKDLHYQEEQGLPEEINNNVTPKKEEIELKEEQNNKIQNDNHNPQDVDKAQNQPDQNIIKEQKLKKFADIMTSNDIDLNKESDLKKETSSRKQSPQKGTSSLGI